MECLPVKMCGDPTRAPPCPDQAASQRDLIHALTHCRTGATEPAPSDPVGSVTQSLPMDHADPIEPFPDPDSQTTGMKPCLLMHAARPRAQQTRTVGIPNRRPSFSIRSATRPTPTAQWWAGPWAFHSFTKRRAPIGKR